MPSIQIEAIDTLFFRDGKPFSMGDDNMATGIFPPPPSVLYGALRTQYFAQNPDKLSYANTPDDPSSQLQLKGVFLKSHTSILLPLPKDMVVGEENEEKPTPTFLTIMDKPPLSNASTPKILGPSKLQKAKGEEFMIDESSWADDYAKGCAGFTPTKLSHYLSTETKIGIGRNRDQRTVQEGHLYRLTLQRLEGKFDIEKPNKPKRLYICADYEGLELNENQLARYGGEHKIIRTNPTDSIEIGCPDVKGDTFKIYLATDAIFKSGWQPKELLQQHRLELITCALGKYVNVGGFDMKANKPKPMYRCVPAGSVYYVKAENEQKAREAAQAIHYTCISDLKTDKFDAARQGFGLALIANFNPDEQR
ncbi:MAG: type III-B CRISPR module-associated protein Cmr3 [Chitinophagales bacterium]|nr:type III-B CRISPR module-associated protein Cmr3 [Chitinophagales bacterium]